MKKSQFQWMYDVISNAMLEDDFELTCKFCPGNNIGNCRNKYCAEVLRQLRLCVVNSKED